MIARILTTMNIQTLPPPLVIDKSFSQAVKSTQLSQLSKERTLLIPYAFIYEVFTTEPKKIFTTLEGFDEFRIVDVSALLRSESVKGEPCRSASLQPFVTDMDVLSLTWQPSPLEMDMTEQHKRESIDPLMDLWNKLIGIEPAGFTPTELDAASGSEAEFTPLCGLLRDSERIKIIAKVMSFSHSERLDKSWFTFRFIQTVGLHSLVMRRRYPGPLSDPSQERIEDDLQDMEYLALGLHVGSLATNDVSPKLSKASLGWRFKLLEPKFELVLPLHEFGPKHN